ncbi:helix-turn-helix domain-containing protein [Actinacidiphila sp. ITFR-21]|uniref:helix-turn-helix domain-containing protein n=1 Tax=Actinacidiphila sp. ITFR-21 TaxID=3075199 RepID=UPI00288A946D|nr:helix-turn-helix domain-containing protein [Streptomyces sp. ITFR-21]WNI16650.1 helix-turn-helix domain-containing protein [Streptomyces sp. ITFR-21]
MIPVLHTPAEVAEALGCSEWWVKEQARQRRFPHVRAAGNRIRFLQSHLDVILRRLERPVIEAAPETTAGRQQPALPPITLLQSRPPRRARRTA